MTDKNNAPEKAQISRFLTPEYLDFRVSMATADKSPQFS